MKNIAIISASALCLSFVSCNSEKNSPDQELVQNALEKSFQSEKYKLNVSDITLEKSQSTENVYNWKANVRSTGEYWVNANRDEFNEEHEYKSVQLLQKKTREEAPDFATHQYKFPNIVINQPYKKSNNSKGPIDVYGKLNAEYVVDKWSIEITDVDSDSRSKLQAMTEGKEKSSLSEQAVLLGTDEAQKITEQFKNDTNAEIERMKKVIDAEIAIRVEKKKKATEKRDQMLKLASDKKTISMMHPAFPEALKLTATFTELTKGVEEASKSIKTDNQGIVDTFKGKSVYKGFESEFEGKITYDKDNNSYWSMKINREKGYPLALDFAYDGEKFSRHTPYKEFKVEN